MNFVHAANIYMGDYVLPTHFIVHSVIVGKYGFAGSTAEFDMSDLYLKIRNRLGYYRGKNGVPRNPPTLTDCGIMNSIIDMIIEHNQETFEVILESSNNGEFIKIYN